MNGLQNQLGIKRMARRTLIAFLSLSTALVVFGPMNAEGYVAARRAGYRGHTTVVATGRGVYRGHTTVARAYVRPAPYGVARRTTRRMIRRNRY